MAVKDERKLEQVKNNPGVYRRHANGCTGGRTCPCPYIVRWKQGGRSHKQMFGQLALAREFKATLGSGKSNRRPQSSATVGDYFAAWFPRYRGRTSRGLDDSTREEYAASFRLHIKTFPIARLRMRDLASSDVRDWLAELEKRGASPSVIRNARGTLSVMLSCAAEDSDIAANPSREVRYIPSDQAKAAHPKRVHRPLTASDITKILQALPEQWQAFFTLLAQSGLRISELFGLQWRHVHLGDDPHILVMEQARRGKVKKLKTAASEARVPISPTMASWLTELRPQDAAPDALVFPSSIGTPLHYGNMLRRVLKPALERSGVAVQTGTKTVRKRGEDVEVPVWDYQGIAFHAFRKACGSLLLDNGKSLKQVQGWLRHSQLTTTMNIYITQVDDGLGGADAWETILPRDQRQQTA